MVSDSLLRQQLSCVPCVCACLPFGWVGKNAISNNRFSHFCIAIFFFIRLPLRRQSIFICWIRNGIRVMCALLNIFLFEFCFSFVLLFSFSQSAIEICHAYRLTLAHSLTDSLFLFLGFASRWISFHVVLLADLHSVADIDFHKMQKDTRATHRYCL